MDRNPLTNNRNLKLEIWTYQIQVLTFCVAYCRNRYAYQQFWVHKSVPPYCGNRRCVPKPGLRSCTTKAGHTLRALCVDLIGPYTHKGKRQGKKVTCSNYTKEADRIFDRSSAQISNLVYKTWFSRYPRCQYLINDNGSKFKLHFLALCNTYSIKGKPTSEENSHANAILERIHADAMSMLCTA